MDFLNICEREFGTRNLYEILDLNESASNAEGMVNVSDLMEAVF